jgi:hypothetical protein
LLQALNAKENNKIRAIQAVFFIKHVTSFNSCTR